MAQPTGQLLPTPTQKVSFRTHVFAEQGNYTNLLNPFTIDVNNAGNNIAPATLRNQIAAKGANLNLLTLAILHDGAAKIYLCPQRLDQPLGQPAHARYDKIYAFDGDLLDNYTYHAILPNTCYNLIPNSILVPSIPTIILEIGANPNTTTMGLYNVGDANTETVQVRKIVPIPFAYVPIFLSNEVTPRFYFETIYPQIITDQRQLTCAALHHFFQAAITIPATGTPYLVSHPALSPAPRDPVIHNAHKRALHIHLPALSNTQSQLMQNAITMQLGVLATQQQQYCQEDNNRCTANANSIVENWLGPQRFTILLRLSRVATEANLNPIWKRLANSKKSEQVAILQAMFNHYWDQLNKPHLTFAAAASILQTTISLVWSMTTMDAIGTGIQFFHFSDTNLEAAQLRQSEIELMLSGTANATLANAREALDVKVNIPPHALIKMCATSRSVQCYLPITPSRRFLKITTMTWSPSDPSGPPGSQLCILNSHRLTGSPT